MQRELLLLFRRVVDLDVLDAVIVAVGVDALDGTLGANLSGLVLETASACSFLCLRLLWRLHLERYSAEEMTLMFT